MTDEAQIARIRPELAVLSEEAQLRVLSHPERAKILGLLVDRAATAAQVADEIGGTRGRVHYHIRTLAKAGLVEIVTSVQRGGLVEKYYRAVARNFCVTRGIGEHPALGSDVRRMIQASMLGWRREHILEVDQAAIARRIICDCLMTRPGKLVLIEGDSLQTELIQALYKAVDAAGAHALVRFRGRESPSYLTRWKDDLHAAIVMDEPVDSFSESGELQNLTAGSPSRDAALDRLAARALTMGHAGVPGDPFSSPIHRELIAAGVRTIYLGYPTPERARRLGIEFRLLHDAFWTSLDVDYPALAAECAALDRCLAPSREILLRSAGGTDLRVRIDEHQSFLDDGIISDWEVEHRRCWNHLPAGKVILATVKGTAEGTLHSEITDYLGIPIRGIRLTFRGGEVVGATAEENEDLLRRLLEAGHGDARQMATIDVGINPRVRTPIGYAVWDSKSYGNVTIGLGENRGVGGTNESDFAWGLRVVGPRMYADGELILDQGRFRLA